PVRRRICAFCVMVGIAAIAVALLVASPGNRRSRSTVSQPKNVTASNLGRVQTKLASLPVAFERNDGQANPEVRYVARGQGYRLALTPSQAILTLHKRGERSQVLDMIEGKR